MQGDMNERMMSEEELMNAYGYPRRLLSAPIDPPVSIRDGDRVLVEFQLVVGEGGMELMRATVISVDRVEIDAEGSEP